QDRNESLMGHQPFLVIADYFSRHGIATLRCDDRGTADSTGTFAGATSLDFAGDISAEVDWLRAHAGEADCPIDRQRIGLIGHSEGGLIAPIVARDRGDLAFIVLMAGPGVPGRELIPLQSELLLESAGMDSEAVHGARGMSEELITSLFDDSVSASDWEARFHELAREHPVAFSLPASATDDEIKAVSDAFRDTMREPWMAYFLNYDPRPVLRAVTCPILAINGTLDLQVWHEQNLDAIINAVRTAGGDVTAIRYEGLNHLFQPAVTGGVGEYAQIETTIEPLVLEDMTRWILQQ
ncbi:MAG: alpha/beta hydrolase, partial [Phycisphaerales bacterium]|nr:alpha/beta hydrolase [Phycisphaerales bacterium]